MRTAMVRLRRRSSHSSLKRGVRNSPAVQAVAMARDRAEAVRKAALARMARAASLAPALVAVDLATARVRKRALDPVAAVSTATAHMTADTLDPVAAKALGADQKATDPVAVNLAAALDRRAAIVARAAAMSGVDHKVVNPVARAKMRPRLRPRETTTTEFR